MYLYTFLISEFLSQELKIGVKELSFIISGRDFHPGYQINLPPILQDLMEVTLKLDNRYHERQKEKNHYQEKKPETPRSSTSHPQSSSSSSHKKKSFQKRDKPHSSLLNKYFKLMNSEKERRIKEGLCTYCGGKHSLASCIQRPQNKLTQPSGNFARQGKA
ncbi:hypothetical protein O181_130745 [Austropuccinia psidii MF-1]|uniref:Uncharacterized protein n=1 Tax=Austropuccinia psidii MF-1 TaxID=1389203 RepID=A0A9Q3KZL4_9BASI|nr:hypothetical protein [Austropuccinia psidii MF-1]